MTGVMRFTILGCGSSGGVPRIGNDWGVCDPGNPKNRRTRCSLLVQRWAGAPGEPKAATTVLIDTAPDMREQLLATQVVHLDAVLYSHDHADQAHGIDDLRALVLRNKKRTPIWMDAATRATLTARFGYCFAGQGGYPAILHDAGVIEHGASIAIDGPGGVIEALPLIQDHGGGMSYGFRFGSCAYNNDVAQLPDETLAALQDLDLWIVDALRYAPHPTHAHLERTLGWAAALRPRRTLLTNLHVDMDYARLCTELPAGVEPAFDGWRLDAPV
jgi:phosphoribosyl 1,2-cyclic phosphate phosphodiesterase